MHRGAIYTAHTHTPTQILTHSCVCLCVCRSVNVVFVVAVGGQVVASLCVAILIMPHWLMTKINQRVALVWKGYRNIKLYAQLIHKEGIEQAQQLPSLDLLPPLSCLPCPDYISLICWIYCAFKFHYLTYTYKSVYISLHLSLLQSLLTHVSRPTKNTLNKLGVFTVSSFHAFICARSPSLLNNLLAGRGATKRRPPMLSRSNSGSSRRSMQVSVCECVMWCGVLVCVLRAMARGSYE